ncbi:MAG: alpha/beta fold hydrolase [Succinivibrio sp.]
MNKIADFFLTTEQLKEKRAELEEFFNKNVQKLSFKNSEGFTITAAKMDVPEASDTLVIIPGRGEIAHKFTEFLYTLYNLKISAVILFARGQGESTRLLKNRQKCHIDRFENIASDDCFMLDSLGIKNYKLLAFSLGGLVSLDIIKNQKNKPSRAALIAPYVWPKFFLPPKLLKILVYSLGSTYPFSTIYTPHGSSYKRIEFATNHHSHCQERFDAYHDYYAEHPELTIGGPTFQFVKEAMRKQIELFESDFDFTIPVYCQSAGLDKVVDTQAAENFFNRHRNDSCVPIFETIEGAFHDIINEADEFRIPSLSKALKFLSLS